MPTLRELDGCFIGRRRDYGSFDRLYGIGHAQGLMFRCPDCWGAADRVSHYHICWFGTPPNGLPVPDDAQPVQNRYGTAGTSLNNLTLDGWVYLSDSPCRWRGAVQNGKVLGSPEADLAAPVVVDGRRYR